MVHPKLTLKPIFRLPLRCCHDSRIINKHIERLALAQKCIRSSPHALQGIVVHLKQLNASGFEEGFTCFFSLLQVSDCEKYLASCCREGSTGFWADACGAAGHKEDFVGELPYEAFVLDYLKRGGAGISWAVEVGDFMGFCVFVRHFGGGGDVVYEVEES